MDPSVCPLSVRPPVPARTTSVTNFFGSGHVWLSLKDSVASATPRPSPFVMDCGRIERTGEERRGEEAAEPQRRSQ